MPVCSSAHARPRRWVALVVGLVLLAQPGLAQRVPLGPEVNSDLYDESAPLLSADGTQLWFWSSERPDGFGIQDIYYTQLDSVGSWLPAQNLGLPLNTPDCNIALSVTPDGNQLLVYRRNTRPGYSDLALARKYPQGWGPPSSLKIEGFESQGASGITAYLGADGLTLLLSVYTDQGLGREDLYVCFYDSQKRTWSRPLNLGPTLNTPGSETTPFLAPDGLTLYFSSTEHGSLGGDDVYVSRRLDDSWTRWSRPVNLGPTLNSPGDDYYFKFPADAEYGYLVSNHERPTRDIFRVKLPPSALPKPVLQIKGRVLDQETGQPLAARVRYEDLATGQDAGTALTDTVTGEYRILLPAGTQIGFSAEAPGYMAISENLTIQLPPGKRFDQASRDLRLAQLKTGQKIRLNNLFFASGQATLQPTSLPELRRLVAILKQNPDMVIEVGGHTDAIGTDEINLPLSAARAQAVVTYLYENGIASTQAFAKGYGSSQPVGSNATAEGRAQNRRVEITILLFPGR